MSAKQIPPGNCIPGGQQDTLALHHFLTMENATQTRIDSIWILIGEDETGEGILTVKAPDGTPAPALSIKREDVQYLQKLGRKLAQSPDAGPVRLVRFEQRFEMETFDHEKTDN